MRQAGDQGCVFLVELAAVTPTMRASFKSLAVFESAPNSYEFAFLPRRWLPAPGGPGRIGFRGIQTGVVLGLQNRCSTTELK